MVFSVVDHEDTEPSMARSRAGSSGRGGPHSNGGDTMPATISSRQDLLDLPHIADKLPYGAFLVAIVELCERFAYYGLSGPLQNYISNAYQDPNGLPGALGLGQPSATAITNLFQFWSYLTPILGAVISDQYLGKYAMIKWSSMMYMAGIVVLFASSLPWSIERGIAFPGLISAMFIIGLGTGGIKSNVSPLIAEQVRSTEPYVTTLQNGERAVVDPELTVQRIYMIFYMCINVGSISAIATTLLETHIGFWSAFLVPLIMFVVGLAVLIRGRENYVINPPQGGTIWNSLRITYISLREGFDLDAARPSLQSQSNRKSMTWDDAFVDELKTALIACKMFLFYPIYWVTFSQMLNNFISQAGQMKLHGLPNDILPNIDPITIILLIPIMDRIIYPFFRTRLNLALDPVTRIAFGFFFAGLAMLYAGTLQVIIYHAPPCYSSPLQCETAKADGGTYRPNNVHVAWQAPAYVLVALSEILASVTGLELAYQKAPKSMKSFIMSLFLLTSAVGSVIGVIIAPLARDPHLHLFYFGLGIAATATGCVFWRVFRGAPTSMAKREDYELLSKSDESDNEEDI